MSNMLVGTTPRYTACHRYESWYQTVLKKQSEMISLEEHIKKVRERAYANLNIK